MDYPILILIFIAIFFLYNQKTVIAKKITKKRSGEEKTKMVELAKRFIGKSCIIYSFDSSHAYQGIIKEVSDGAVLIDNNGTAEAINLDFVIRIKEHPKNKKGKNKAIIAD